MTIPRIMRIIEIGLTIFFLLVIVEIWRIDPKPTQIGLALKIILSTFTLRLVYRAWTNDQRDSDDAA